MHKDSFDFVYNAEGDYYDLVVDKKIQKVVEELKALPHDVLIRYLTYWSEAIDSRKYVVESDLPHEEWYTDCCDYAASETDDEKECHRRNSRSWNLVNNSTVQGHKGNRRRQQRSTL